MSVINYIIEIANWSVNSVDDPHTELSQLTTGFTLNSPNDTCCITVYAPQSSSNGAQITQATGILGSGGEALSVQVRGNEIKQGDPVTIEFTVRDIVNRVMTAKVAAIYSSFEKTMIKGVTDMHKLAGTRINQVYENQTLAQIVNDLADQAGVDTGEIETGSTYSYFVIHESKNLLKHICDLAMREGMDFYFDTDNKLTVKKFNKTRADHIFRFGIDILDLQVFGHQPTTDHILIYGESPSSNQGSDTWHWIAKDISPFQSEVGQGGKTLAIQDGAIRTKDAADNFAVSKLGAIKDQSTWGRLKILGNPTVKLADAIEIRDSKKPELNGLFKVTEVRHILNKQEGFLTYIGFTGIGGTESASSLLGGSTGGL